MSDHAAHLLWGGYGPLTRALLWHGYGFLFGVGHRWRPDACPWVEPSDYMQGPPCPPQAELVRPVAAWNRQRLLQAVDVYEATEALVDRWPMWNAVRVETP